MKTLQYSNDDLSFKEIRTILEEQFNNLIESKVISRYVIIDNTLIISSDIDFYPPMILHLGVMIGLAMARGWQIRSVADNIINEEHQKNK